MKKNNKSRKGFTIVELVIVIAVIAILAGVLIPTFSGVVTKANESKALQEAKNAYTEALATVLEDGVIDTNEATSTTKGVYTFTFENNALKTAKISGDAYTFTVENGTITKATTNPNPNP